MQIAVQLKIAIDLQVKYNFSCLFILLHVATKITQEKRKQSKTKAMETERNKNEKHIQYHGLRVDGKG